jgi:hypothetical protein
MRKITQKQVDAATNGKMLECPFCGAFPVANPWHGGGPRKIYISCNNDECRVNPGLTGENPEEALIGWNQRM